MAMFQEVFTSSGVDERASPPGMIVPLGPGKFNIVRLTGGTGLHLEHPKTITHEELSGSALLTIASIYLASLGLEVNLPFTMQPDTRYFKISGRLPLRVDVTAVGRRGVEARLKVAVLKLRPVDLSIRPVQVRANPQSGALVFHSKKPFDVNAMVDHMNSIWTPQANVVFNLVSSTPVPIIDEVEIGKVYEQSGPEPLPPMVVIDRVKNILNRNRDQKAELTLFLVQQCGRLAGKNIQADDGVSDREFPIGLISDGRTSIHELLAHEAGHLIGRRLNGGKNFPDLDSQSAVNQDSLMKGGGAEAAKIPFDQAITYFNKP